mmetsp:Transcript_22165/g.48148  ORF Transcript_22165/g.48148 Transcript_22165/m.48148 type:complete len:213 (-) Transcript_22165:71-709(-)
MSRPSHTSTSHWDRRAKNESSKRTSSGPEAMVPVAEESKGPRCRHSRATTVVLPTLSYPTIMNLHRHTSSRPWCKSRRKCSTEEPPAPTISAGYNLSGQPAILSSRSCARSPSSNGSRSRGLWLTLSTRSLVSRPIPDGNAASWLWETSSNSMLVQASTADGHRVSFSWEKSNSVMRLSANMTSGWSGTSSVLLSSRFPQGFVTGDPSTSCS